HLRPRVTRVRNSNSPLGTVIRTEPAGGSKAVRDDDVVLVVSAGRPIVPGIRVGAPVAEVEAAIRSAELQPKQGDDSQRVYDATAPAGTVVKLSPASGTPVELGSTVTMILSKGPPPAKVPDVSGKTKEEAFADLQAA